MRHLISFTKPCSNFSHCHKFLNCFSYQVFVGARLHVSGGVLRGGRVIDAEASVAVLDTAAGVWLDRNGQVTSARGSKGQIDQDPSFELMRRCRHGAASVGIRIYVHGGLRGDVLLDDFLVAENSTFQSDISSPLLASDRTQQSSTPRFSYAARPPSGSEPSFSMSEGLSLDENSLEKLTEASAAEAEVASSVWRAAQLGAGTLDEEPSTSDASSPIVESTTDGTANEGDVRLHPRAVVVAKETVGSLGGMVRQLSLDQFQNESRRMVPMNNSDVPQPTKKFTRQKSPQGLHKKVIAALLRPRNWKPPGNRKFFLDSYEVGELCYAAEQIFMHEQTVLQLKAPIKVFGDLHGQFGDLMRLFDEYGFPSTAGDITYIDYLFLGDYVDRGQHSLETITLLLALKIEYPENVHLIRGNHEAADINALFGFRLECIERMGENDGIWAWTRFNQLFNYLPLAALIENKIICMHGGIGRSISTVEQIEKIERPITMDAGSLVLMDLLW
jgi:protein phosphatase